LRTQWNKVLGGADPKFSGVAAGIAELTGQQRRVLEMLVEGKSNKIIAYELDIAESTVKAHVSAILRKLQVHSRTQAVIKAGPLLPYV
ncbi:MAG: response regulator transcription factor, partial [Rhodospirillaceae bacterium]